MTSTSTSLSKRPTDRLWDAASSGLTLDSEWQKLSRWAFIPHRRKGLAGALCYEAVARVARRGGSEVFINTGPRTAYPHRPPPMPERDLRFVL